MADAQEWGNKAPPASVTVVGNPFSSALTGPPTGAAPSLAGPPPNGSTSIIVTTDISSSAADALAAARKLASANVRPAGDTFSGSVKGLVVCIAVFSALSFCCLAAGANLSWVSQASSIFFAMWYFSMCGIYDEDGSMGCTVYNYGVTDTNPAATMGYLAAGT